jgi:selenocysteine lyase/cysteine desulfurase
MGRWSYSGRTVDTLDRTIRAKFSAMREPNNSFESMKAMVREQDISRRHRYRTPFGQRLICYADLTASGRHMECVESWMAALRPLYANSHTEVSSTGRLITELREDARKAIHRSVHAGDDDVVVFTGSGATAAINKLVGLLGLRISDLLDSAHHLSESIPAEQRPLVFLGPYEHHSNELPWLESVAEVEEVALLPDGRIDLSHLERRLTETSDRPLRIGSFSAASNVTGILSEVGNIAAILHRHNALAFFDYAASAPYVPIDMHPDNEDERLDAIFLSPHKFIGGPGGSGILVAHRSLFKTKTPERPGGGTVDYVAGPERSDVDYVSSLAEREEGGTPAIMGDLRAAAAILIKERIGPAAIRDHEIEISHKAMARLQRHPGIRILGPTELPRLAIISLSIEKLHHDFVSILLDHLFGIQNRSGCSCAGPYGHRLLGIHRNESNRFRALLQKGFHGIKPGWVRLSIPWYATDAEIDFLLEATEFVADHGEQFLPLYEFGWRDGVWRHAGTGTCCAGGPELTADAILAATMPDYAGTGLDETSIQDEQARYLRTAREQAAVLTERWESEPPDWNRPSGVSEIDELVWFRYVNACS